MDKEHKAHLYLSYIFTRSRWIYKKGRALYEVKDIEIKNIFLIGEK